MDKYLLQRYSGGFFLSTAMQQRISCLYQEDIEITMQLAPQRVCK